MILRPHHNTYHKPSLIQLGKTELNVPVSSNIGTAGSLGGLFNRARFRSPGLPVGICRHKLLSAPNVLRIPIKRPGTLFVIPEQLNGLRGLIEITAEHEATINPAIDDMHVHITHHREFVLHGETQRMPGFHVDGFQGLHKDYKPVEHSYIITTADPTEFSEVGYDLDHFNTWEHMFDKLDGLVDRSTVFETEEDMVYLMSCYQVHRTKPVTRSRYRTFCRVTYTHEELKDNRNTINPHFDGQVYPDRVDIRELLK